MTSWSEHRGPRGAEYDERWERLAASGENVHGEADFVERYHPRTVLDAGCGTGRVAVELDRRGIEVVGTDLDEAMLTAARTKAPHIAWVTADLSKLDLTADDADPTRRRFDLAVLAGNVMIFVAPGTEAAVLARLGDHLVDGGILVAGFQLGAQRPPQTPQGPPGGRLSITDYDRVATAAGFELVERFATWSGDPFVDGGDYAVSVHRLTRRTG